MKVFRPLEASAPCSAMHSARARCRRSSASRDRISERSSACCASPMRARVRSTRSIGQRSLEAGCVRIVRSWDRHTFASLGRTAGESAFNVARMMGHSRSTLVDQVYAHSMQSGMARVAEKVTARALGLKPQLRVIEGSAPAVREPLEQAAKESEKNVLSR